MSRTDEPQIVINGVTLTTAQAMTMRCALEHLAAGLYEDRLGGDRTGRAIAAGYMRAIEEIRRVMYRWDTPRGEDE